MDDEKKASTETSPFGSPGRISHDASRFYNSKLYEDQAQEQDIPYVEVPVPTGVLDQVLPKSSEAMEELPDNSIHLMVTSPPYNVQKEYDQNLTLPDYLSLLDKVWRETYRVLVPGGRACINVANLGRKPYIPLHSFIIESLLEIGFLMRGEIIWNKAASASPSTAWGSWRSASNPVLRDVHEFILVFSKEGDRPPKSDHPIPGDAHEYILVFSKGTYRRPQGDRVDTIQRDDFLAWTKSVWEFPAVQASKIGHPAPFPIELPHRCIQLYSYREDVVLDPFAGSGTTCLAAQHDGRHFVGYEINPAYCQLAETRLKEDDQKK